MTNRLRDDLLICPQKLSACGQEVPLRQEEGLLRGGLGSYPIVEGVPDLRLEADRGVTSYDDLLSEFAPPSAEGAEALIHALGLTRGDIEGKRVLIAWVATGSELANLAPYGPAEFHMIDFSDFVRHLARAMGGANRCFYLGDICHLPFRSGCFELILCNGVLQHTRSPEVAFRELVRVLASGGVLAIGNSYPPNLHNRRVNAHRLKRNLHEMTREAAKQIRRCQAKLYSLFARTGLWRLHRRLPFSGVLEFNSISGKDFGYYFVNACAYYLPKYRYLIGRADIVGWCQSLAVALHPTPKRVKIVKVSAT